MELITILIVEKNGNIQEVNVNKIIEEDLYKIAKFKNKKDFKCINTWNINNNNISIYGKEEGRSGQENKYEFPPPIDTNLFFGNCLIINKQGNRQYKSITKSDWKTIYNELYGGFEELDNDSDEEEFDSDNDLPKTKSGYVKDDFIVEDDNEDEDEAEDDAEAEDEDEDDDEESSGDEELNNQKRDFGTRSKKNVPHIFMLSDCDDNELSEEEYI
tara:strand:- start:3127 stop:3771 length:645 start_codon:yes stop_codon:yes gene_type:complete